jgi:multiple sugar transport system ATP-binding protein
MSGITLQNITKRFGQVTALKDVSFTVQDSEFFILLGPTGAGKTTTLRVISGLEKQDEGHVFFGEQNMDAVSPAERDTAIVFQEYSLYPTMSVFDNMAFPLRSPMRSLTKEQIRQRVEQAAETLQITHLLQRKTARLSGGEMQRVSIGRAIVRQPRLFLMDEPLSNLDAKMRETLRVELQHLQKEQGITTLFVTHDQIEALTMADRIGVLNLGRLIQIGTPVEIYDHPATTFVAQLIGTPRITLAQAEREDGFFHLVGSPLRVPIPEALASRLPPSFQFGIRAEDVQVVPAESAPFSGQVALTEPLGTHTVIHIKAGDQTITSSQSGIASYHVGETIHFKFNTARAHYFDADGACIMD